MNIPDQWDKCWILYKDKLTLVQVRTCYQMTQGGSLNPHHSLYTADKSRNLERYYHEPLYYEKADSKNDLKRKLLECRTKTMLNYRIAADKIENEIKEISLM